MSIPNLQKQRQVYFRLLSTPVSVLSFLHVVRSVQPLNDFHTFVYPQFPAVQADMIVLRIAPFHICVEPVVCGSPFIFIPDSLLRRFLRIIHIVFRKPALLSCSILYSPLIFYLCLILCKCGRLKIPLRQKSGYPTPA